MNNIKLSGEEYFNGKNIYYKGCYLPNTGIIPMDLFNTILCKIDTAIKTVQSDIIWGNITGTITNQTDLISYLTSNYYSITNPNHYISSASLITLTDTYINSPSVGQILTYNGTKWTNTTISSSFTGWDDMLSINQVQTTDRIIDIGTYSLTIHDYTNLILGDNGSRFTLTSTTLDWYSNDSYLNFDGSTRRFRIGDWTYDWYGTSIDLNDDSGARTIDYKAYGGHNFFGGAILATDGAIEAIGTITGSSLITTGGISSQFVKGDGTLDTNTYLTTSSASSTYEPKIIAGTTSQYWRGDKTWQTLTIPSVGTWGVLNYPTWVSGTPFVKMTASGTFTLDNSVYLTAILGTINRISTSGNTIDIASTYIGQSSITTLGTISVGTWNGTSITDSYISSATTWNSKLTSPLTTKGDILVYSTLNTRLPVGTDGQVLTADSTQTTGIKWYTPTIGTVTSVALSVPTGLTITGSPIISSGTLAITLTSGYIIPTTSQLASYLTANQSITFTGSGDISGTASGTTSISPTLTLATITQVNSGSFVKITLDTKGRVVGNTAVTTSDLTGLLSSSYLPLIGGDLTGTGGLGYHGFIPQSSTPSTPSIGFRLFADVSGKFNWVGTNGYTRSFDGTSNTANRIYTLPDRNITFDNITISTTTNLSSGFIKSNGTTITLDSTSYIGTSLTSSNIFVGNVSNIATGVSLSGDSTITNTGVLTNTGIQGKSITLATGFLKYNGSSWIFDNSSYITSNLYILDGTLTSNRTINAGGFTLNINPQTTFNPSITASGGTAKGILFTPILTAAATSDKLIGLEINPTYTLGSYTLTQSIALNIISGRITWGSPAYNSNGDGQLKIATTPSSLGGIMMDATGLASNLSSRPTIGFTATSNGLMAGYMALSSNNDLILLGVRHIQGLTSSSSNGFSMGGSLTPIVPLGRIHSGGIFLNGTLSVLTSYYSNCVLTASNTNDKLIGHYINDTFNDNSQTGVSHYGIYQNNTASNYLQGVIIAGNTIRLKSYTVATLPSGVQGDMAYVTDALAPTFLVTVVGGGAIVCPVFYNGINWVAH